ncbi:hypothetical protein [Novipirellula galeiformis]|uniref:hypothetical protein n=1 Tax=Novipirellula galeiformis TaxID=2528004 RepID=UPI0011B7B64D|nr:hypothetical protein [Novipirellula galeiformis]
MTVFSSFCPPFFCRSSGMSFWGCPVFTEKWRQENKARSGARYFHLSVPHFSVHLRAWGIVWLRLEILNGAYSRYWRAPFAFLFCPRITPIDANVGRLLVDALGSLLVRFVCGANNDYLSSLP